MQTQSVATLSLTAQPAWRHKARVGILDTPYGKVLKIPTARMADPQFSVLEHKLPQRIGLSEDQIRSWRLENLVKSTDWQRIGRWVKWTEDGVKKLEAFHAVQLNPPPAAPEEKWAEVTRCNFPNTRIIEVLVEPFEVGRKLLVRIKPDWHNRYKPKMRIKIFTNGEPLATTRCPRARYSY